MKRYAVWKCMEPLDAKGWSELRHRTQQRTEKPSQDGILKKPFLDAPRYGVINTHLGLLPL